MMKHEGGCVCGHVRCAADGDPERVTVCHCAWCQRRTGTAFGIEAVFRQEQVEITTGSVKVYRHISDESGRWLDQHFCPNCGSNIGFALEAVPEIRTIAAGTFDDPSWIDAAEHQFRYVYLRSAQNWSDVPGGCERYEEHFQS